MTALAPPHPSPPACRVDDDGGVGRRRALIRDAVLVLSGKGGVGKSTVAVNLAAGLRNRGLRCGLLDVDVHGPSIPIMLGLEEARITEGPSGLNPVYVDGLAVMSLAFFLEAPGAAVIWRGPRKMGAIRQLIGGTNWGELDVLVVDCPPGTGDEPLSVSQLLGQPQRAVIVTTPQDVASRDVARSIDFCRHLEIPIVGIVENMAGFACPDCGAVSFPFRSGGGRRLAEAHGVRFLASLPIDAAVAESGDAGRPMAGRSGPAAAALAEVVDAVGAACSGGSASLGEGAAT